MRPKPLRPTRVNSPNSAIMKTLLAAALALVLTLPARADDGVTQPGRGINLGNFLEAPTEGAWTGGRRLQESDFVTIKQAGFTFVRVPIRWAAHFVRTGGGVQPDNGLPIQKLTKMALGIDPKFMARVDWVVAQAEKNGLTVILDYHNDDALMKNPDAEEGRFLMIWEQIAVHFRDAPPTILFELLNEPNGKL